MNACIVLLRGKGVRKWSPEFPSSSGTYNTARSLHLGKRVGSEILNGDEREAQHRVSQGCPVSGGHLRPGLRGGKEYWGEGLLRAFTVCLPLIKSDSPGPPHYGWVGERVWTEGEVVGRLLELVQELSKKFPLSWMELVVSPSHFINWNFS